MLRSIKAMSGDPAQLRFLITSILGGVIRGALFFVLGGWIAKGYVSGSHLDRAAPLLAAVAVTASWSAWKHYRAELRTWIALRLHKGATRGDLEKAVKGPGWVK